MIKETLKKTWYKLIIILSSSDITLLEIIWRKLLLPWKKPSNIPAVPMIETKAWFQRQSEKYLDSSSFLSASAGQGIETGCVTCTKFSRCKYISPVLFRILLFRNYRVSPIRQKGGRSAGGTKDQTVRGHFTYSIHLVQHCAPWYCSFSLFSETAFWIRPTWTDEYIFPFPAHDVCIIRSLQGGAGVGGVASHQDRFPALSGPFSLDLARSLCICEDFLQLLQKHASGLGSLVTLICPYGGRSIG